MPSCPGTACLWTGEHGPSPIDIEYIVSLRIQQLNIGAEAAAGSNIALTTKRKCRPRPAGCLLLQQSRGLTGQADSGKQVRRPANTPRVTWLNDHGAFAPDSAESQLIRYGASTNLRVEPSHCLATA